MRLKRIVIENYRSYKYAEIDFTKLRKALITGINEGDASSSNNSGKSNFFRAIGWVIWGESDAKTLDENVRWGTTACSVELWFEHDGKEGYIKRTRNSENGTSTLKFNINGEDSKGGKSPTLTQQKILDFIKIDYDTYSNSVYVDEDNVFSIANPKDASQGRDILERILKLDEYDGYEELTKKKIKLVEKSIVESEFFVGNNKDVESKIITAKSDIETIMAQVVVVTDEIEVLGKELEKLNKTYNEQKDAFNSHKSVSDQIARSKEMVENKKAEIEKDKAKGKVEVANRERHKEELKVKISKKSEIEQARLEFLKEVEISDGYKRELDAITNDLVSKKQELETINVSLRSKENEKLLLERDLKIGNAELDKIKEKAKNIKVVAGEKCVTCMTDITEHNIESIKKHYKDEYVKKVEELSVPAARIGSCEGELEKLQAPITALKKIIADDEAKANELRGKIITKQQYEDRLMLLSSKLSDISKYERELEDLPETKIINMLTAKIQQTKTDIETEEKHIEKLQAKLDTIKVDVQSLKNLEDEGKRVSESKHHKEMNKNTLETNINNLKVRVREYEVVIDQVKEHNKLVNGNKAKLVVLEQLEKAFSSKGVRAKIIEDAIRELETEADAMLKRLTAGKLSVSFVTERDGKVVFEARVSEGQKTLNFPLYSRSQRMRIGFSLRMALSKLLMRRANSKLDFLFIDEADASLDERNGEEIIDIINELQEEFHTILCISHRHDIKSNFEDIITVFNDGESSTIV